jgi:hypothetical protein
LANDFRPIHEGGNLERREKKKHSHGTTRKKRKKRYGNEENPSGSSSVLFSEKNKQFLVFSYSVDGIC